MPRIERETLVKAPPERVFTLLSHPAERARWLTTFKEQPGPESLAVGSRIQARRNDPASRSTYEILVTALEAPRRMATEIRRNGEPAAKGGFEVHAAPEGSRVKGWAEFELKGLQKMMTPLVSANTEKGLEADLASLKKWAEHA